MTRIIFMGTPDFSLPSLKLLLEKTSYEIIVYTRPAKPPGRGLEIEPSSVELFAKEKNIPLHTPLNLKDEATANTIKKLSPDYIITCAYGLFLPKTILQIPKKACINIHPSLLPKYRGAAPINWTLINGDKETGVTTMYMDEGMDTGDILFQKKIEILPNDNAEILAKRLSFLSAECLIEARNGFERGTIIPKPQNNSEATFAPLLKKDLGKIDWNQPAEKIHNLIRGLYPWPGTYTLLDGIALKLFSSELLSDIDNQKKTVGTILLEREDGIVVATGKQNILIKEAQLPNKKRMNISQILKGYRGKKILG